MTDATFTTHTQPVRSRLAAFGNRILDGMAYMMEHNARLQRVQRLQSLSDESLAARGIARDDIVRHVFKDVYYL